MKKYILFALLVSVSSFVKAQTDAINIKPTGLLVDYDGNGTSAIDASALLQLDQDGVSTKGFLAPRVALTTNSTTAAPVVSPANSLLIYNTATVGDVTPGFYYWSTGSSSWVRLLSGSANGIRWDQILNPSTGLTLSHGTNATVFNFANSTTDAFTMNATAQTSGDLLVLTSPGTATGNTFLVSSAASGLVTNGIVNFNFTGTHGNNGFQVDDVTTSGTAVAINGSGVYTGTNGIFAVTANSATTGTIAKISGTGLLGGNGLVIQGPTSGATLTGNLLQVATASTGAAANGFVRYNFSGAHTGNGFQIDDITATGNAMAINANSVTTGKAMVVSSNGLTTGTGVNISSASTAGTASSSTTLLNLARSGANANASHTAYGVQSAVTNTGTTNTNIAGYFSASGATNNYAIIVPSAGGNVGIGLTNPSSPLSIFATGGKEVLIGGGATTGSELKLSHSGVSHFSMYNSGNNKLTFANTSTLLTTNTAGTVLMTLDNTGVLNLPNLGTSAAVYTDASRNLTTTAPTTGGIGYWTRTGTNMYNTNTGDNVSVGTSTNFISKFQVGGTLTVGDYSSAGVVGAAQITTGGASPISNRLTYGTDGTGWKFAIAKNQGGTVTEQLTIQDNGNVGIATTIPTQILDVNGSVRVRGGSPAAGKVLTSSDGLGNATWGNANSAAYDNFNYIIAGTAGWFKLGTIALPQGGYDAYIEMHCGNGYNASVDQNAYVTLSIRTSNGGSVDANGFAASGSVSVFGRNSASIQQVKLKANAAGVAATSYDIFVYAATFIGNGFYSVQTSGGTWTPSSTAGADPGAASSTVGVMPFEHVINTNVGIGVTPSGTYKLQVSGKLLTSGIDENSDIRLKKDINPITDALHKVLEMQGVTYRWRKDEFPERGLDTELQYGLIAQELEKIIPELVTTDVDGYKAIEYSHLVPVLIEAIKELSAKNESQQAVIDGQQKTNDELKASIENLVKRMSVIENNVESKTNKAENK